MDDESLIFLKGLRKLHVRLTGVWGLRRNKTYLNRSPSLLKNSPSLRDKETDFTSSGISRENIGNIFMERYVYGTVLRLGP